MTIASAVLMPVALSLIWSGTTITGSGKDAVGAQVHEHVGDEHRHGPVSEVDDTAAAVLEYQAQAKDGVGGARAEAEDQEE